MIGEKIIGWAKSREVDVVIGGVENPYMLRWYLIPHNRLLNIYVHLFLRSDDDRALHDHPWVNVSWLLSGEYVEYRILDGGICQKLKHVAGNFLVRLSGRIAHRIELCSGPCWTLFITGPKYRDWGFHCREKGWVHWEDFVDTVDKGSVGAGCN